MGTTTRNNYIVTLRQWKSGFRRLSPLRVQRIPSWSRRLMVGVELWISACCHISILYNMKHCPRRLMKCVSWWANGMKICIMKLLWFAVHPQKGSSSRRVERDDIMTHKPVILLVYFVDNLQNIQVRTEVTVSSTYHKLWILCFVWEWSLRRL